MGHQIPSLEFLHTYEKVDYLEALSFMTNKVEGIVQKQQKELLWFLEHDSLYTAGSSAKPQDLLLKNHFPVYQTSRGGQYTYHGPGQRIVYVMLDLARFQHDVHLFVRFLETWLIRALALLNVKAFTAPNRVGVWVYHQNQEKKIAAIGIRLKRWISFHGISLNINPALEHFSGIVPCGLKDFGVTSLKELDKTTCFKEVDEALKKAFCEMIF
ncbi:MAG TPA: lipoyl(octanoyl) transferase LipB [Alphaproteobacteria bacterium]|nr:lipoyl(octanoyl) transferase LipB [Alphaproteobacteria bacterium]